MEDLKKRKKNNVKSLTNEEKNLLTQIKLKTKERNFNNVTRTRAYLEFYKQHPEIHWAFLGHMVSRNGGWNMTDLKGELLSNLLTNKEKRMFYFMLERGNWLIFQDAYPQFLIYQESLKQNQPFFHLFSYLNISMFMEIIWNYFWKTRNKVILTIALIINEQSYLEKRVVQNPLYKNEVLNKLEFKLQDILSFNHILFPYLKNDRLQLIGQTLHHFDSLHQRILLGKRLYIILFKNNDILRNAESWASSQPHTGSRKDYWPHLFNNIREAPPGKTLLRLKSCRIRQGAGRIYSPNLENVWKNIEQVEAERGDWYKDPIVLDYLNELEETVDGEIENEYCKTLARLELASFAKKAITFFD